MGINMLEMGELKNRFDEFAKKPEIKRKIEDGWSKHKEFLDLYPFKEQPDKITELTPEKIYNPGGEYFFYWIEHGLKNLGALGIASAQVWVNAKNNSDKIKDLLQLVVDDSKRLSEKIDADWDSISRFGGERQIAKKIIFCYYPDKMIPVFRNEDLRVFCENLDIEYEKASTEKLNMKYDSLSIGMKYELLNELLLTFKKSIKWLREIDNVYFMRFLFEIFPRERGIIIGDHAEEMPDRILGILLTKFKEGKVSKEQMIKICEGFQAGIDFYEDMLLNLLKTLGLHKIPSYENEVIFLFSKLHTELGFPKIKEIHPTKYPDVIALDKEGKERKVELEVFASGFNHDPKGSDFIICWSNDLEDEKTKKLPRIISIEEFLLNNIL